MEDSNTIRVLIADDHAATRHGLTGIINGEPDMRVVAEATEGAEVVSQFRQHLPHVLLTDLRADSTKRPGTIRAVRAAYPAVRIVVLTAQDGEEDIYRALHAGARGYLLKCAKPKEIVACIRSVYAGQKHFAPEVAMKLAQRAMSSELTDRELEVLGEIARDRGNREVARALSISEASQQSNIRVPPPKTVGALFAKPTNRVQKG